LLGKAIDSRNVILAHWIQWRLGINIRKCHNSHCDCDEEWFYHFVQK